MSMRKKSYPYSDEGAFPILAEGLYADDDLAFEKMSEELLAYKSDHGKANNRAVKKGPRKSDLKNPSGSCTTPHQVGGVGSGDGTCYQKHHDFGTANAGPNGSTERAEYMKKYRKTKKNPDGVWTPAGPESGKKNIRGVVPKPFGKSKKRASIRVAYLRKELNEERDHLIRLALENPQITGEVNEILNKVAYKTPYEKNQSTKKYKKTKPLYNPRGDGKCLKNFSDFNEKDWDQYAKDYHTKGKVEGGCYQTHHDYGSAPKGGAYQKWYNENVRKYKNPKNSEKPYSGEYAGPESGSKTRNNKFDDWNFPGWAMHSMGLAMNKVKKPQGENNKSKTETQNISDDSMFGGSFGGGGGGTPAKKTDSKKTPTPKTPAKTPTSKTPAKTRGRRKVERAKGKG